jgi:hypothetical protein
MFLANGKDDYRHGIPPFLSQVGDCISAKEWDDLIDYLARNGK